MANNNEHTGIEAWREEFSTPMEELVAPSERTAAAEARRNSEELASSAETFAAEAALALSARMGEKWGVNRPDLLYLVARDFQAVHKGTFNLEYVFMAYSLVSKKNLPTFRIDQGVMDEAYGEVDKVWQRASGDPAKQQGEFRKHMYSHCTRVPQKTWDQRFGSWYKDNNAPLDDEGLSAVVTRLWAKDENLPLSSKPMVDERTSVQVAQAIETLARVGPPEPSRPVDGEASLSELERVRKAEGVYSALVESTKTGTEDEQSLLSGLLLKALSGGKLTDRERAAVNDLYIRGRYPASARVFLALLFT